MYSGVYMHQLLDKAVNNLLTIVEMDPLLRGQAPQSHPKERVEGFQVPHYTLSAVNN